MYWKDQEKKRAKLKKTAAIGLGLAVALVFIFVNYTSKYLTGRVKKNTQALLHVPRPAVSQLIITDCVSEHTNYRRPRNGLCDEGEREQVM